MWPNAAANAAGAAPAIQTTIINAAACATQNTPIRFSLTVAGPAETIMQAFFQEPGPRRGICPSCSPSRGE